MSTVSGVSQLTNIPCLACWLEPFITADPLLPVVTELTLLDKNCFVVDLSVPVDCVIVDILAASVRIVIGVVTAVVVVSLIPL